MSRVLHPLSKYFDFSDGQDISPQKRWHYDSSDGTCKEFEYKGKKGNGNRFLTRQDCQASCQPSQVNFHSIFCKTLCVKSFQKVSKIR